MSVSDRSQEDRSSWSTAHEDQSNGSDDASTRSGAQRAESGTSQNALAHTKQSVPRSKNTSPTRPMATHAPFQSLASLGDPDLADRIRQHRLSQLPLLHEQRHPGKEGAALSRFRRPFEPELEDETKNVPRNLGDKRRPESLELVNSNEGASDDFVHGWPLFFLVTGICLAVFLVSIDRTIITTVRVTIQAPVS